MTVYEDPTQQQQDPNQPQQDPNQPQQDPNQPQQDPNQDPDQQPQQEPGQESEESKYSFGDEDEKAGLSSKAPWVSDHPRGSTPDEVSPDDQSHEAVPQSPQPSESQ